MREVHFKNKNSAHVIVIKGKQIRFLNGVAQVSDSEAEFIKSRGDPDYKVIEPKPEPEPEKPKRQPRKKKAPKKAKE